MRIPSLTKIKPIMSVKLYNLRDVPEDEADEMRELLDQQCFDFYETPGGAWGISAPAFWLKDESELVRAKAVIKDYQAERGARMRAEFERQRAEGKTQTMWDLVLERPVMVVIYIALILFFAYISISPFVNLSAIQ